MNFLELLLGSMQIALVLVVIFWIVVILVAIKLILAVFQIRNNTEETVRLNALILEELESRKYNGETRTETTNNEENTYSNSYQ